MAAGDKLGQWLGRAVFRLFKGNSSDDERARNFVREIFVRISPHLCGVLNSARFLNSATGDVSFPVDDNAKLEVSLAILGTSLTVLKGSPTMTRDRAIQIQASCKRSLQRIFSADDASHMLDVLDEYQRGFEAAMSSNRDPFVDIVGILICRCLGHEAVKLCLPGTDEINPITLTAVADLLALAVVQTASFWKGK